MALGPCVECGWDISRKAVACPQCGNPNHPFPLPQNPQYVAEPVFNERAEQVRLIIEKFYGLPVEVDFASEGGLQYILTSPTGKPIKTADIRWSGHDGRPNPDGRLWHFQEREPADEELAFLIQHYWNTKVQKASRLARQKNLDSLLLLAQIRPKTPPQGPELTRHLRIK